VNHCHLDFHPPRRSLSRPCGGSVVGEGGYFLTDVNDADCGAYSASGRGCSTGPLMSRAVERFCGFTCHDVWSATQNEGTLATADETMRTVRPNALPPKRPSGGDRAVALYCRRPRGHIRSGRFGGWRACVRVPLRDRAAAPGKESTLQTSVRPRANIETCLIEMIVENMFDKNQDRA
jgi:hypothetical protein